MKKLMFAGIALSAVCATPVFAADNTNSTNSPNQKSCFGQGRSDYASTHSGPTSQGTFSSDRAQTPSTDPQYPNQNVQLNKEYKEACQAATSTPST